MIAIDTNVLVRHLVNDDPEQAALARSLLGSASRDRPAFVCREVLVEAVWVLESRYRFERSRVAEALSALLTASGLAIEAADDVAEVAAAYRRGSADFSDLMILAACRRNDALPLFTFDQRLAALDGAALPSHR